jgi:hypothetical protein
MQELFRLIAGTRQAQEVERKRRAAWEEEQETKFNQMKTEFEAKIQALQDEINTLKAQSRNTAPAVYLPTPSVSVTPQVLTPSHSMISTSQSSQSLMSPISPISQHSLPTQPAFVQQPYGSQLQNQQKPPQREQEIPIAVVPYPSDSDFIHENPGPPNPSMLEKLIPFDPPPPSDQTNVSVMPSPQLSSGEVEPPKKKKRRVAEPEQNEDESSGYDSDSYDDDTQRPSKGRNGHDKRSYTIHVRSSPSI